MFCAAVKHAKRLSKRMNSKQKSTDESEDDEDDMVRIITDKSASSPLQSHWPLRIHADSKRSWTRIVAMLFAFLCWYDVERLYFQCDW